MLAEDETHLNLLPWVRATWITRGTCQQVMTPGTNRRRTIVGAVDLRTGRFFYQVAPRRSAPAAVADMPCAIQIAGIGNHILQSSDPPIL